LANVLDVGRLGYLEAWDLQKRIASQVQAGVLDDTLMFVEHPAVLTLGANFHEENLLLTREEYAERGIEVERTDRGGDVTFHGPDQSTKVIVLPSGETWPNGSTSPASLAAYLW